MCRKFFHGILVKLPSWPPRISEIFCKADFHETWYVASRTQAISFSLNDDPRMTLARLTAILET